MMIATEIRRLAHIYASVILLKYQIWLNSVTVNPLTWPFTYMFNFHNRSGGHQNPVSSSIRWNVTADNVSAVDDRHGWAAMLDFTSNMT